MIIHENPRILVVMGSDSDLSVMTNCMKTLDHFCASYDALICSAHRTPDECATIAREAVGRGICVIIAAAGGAAHLAGVIAAHTILPVIAVPIASTPLAGFDSLLSMVQMPPGVPVATVAIDGARHAGILAVQILSVKYPELREVVKEFKARMAAAV